MKNKIINVKGAIFDMDGVLFDTEKLYERFWIEAARQLGYEMNLDDVVAIRSTDSKIAKTTLRQRICADFDYDSVRALRVKIMKEFTDANGVEVMTGVFELFDYLKSQNIKISLATTSNMKRATDYLTKSGLIDYFDYLMTGDLVSNSKPNPEIYQKAAAGLGFETFECIAVEDSYNGVRSAYNAGCQVIMVPDRDAPTSEMYEKCICIVDSAREIVDLV